MLKGQTVRPPSAHTENLKLAIVRLAVRSGVFPLYEVFNGVDYRIKAEPHGRVYACPEGIYTTDLAE